MTLHSKFITSWLGHTKPWSSHDSDPIIPSELDANETMLWIIRQVMAGMREHIIDKFDSIIAEAVKREIPAALELHDTKLMSHGDVTGDLQWCVSNHDGQIAVAFFRMHSLHFLIYLILGSTPIFKKHYFTHLLSNSSPSVRITELCRNSLGKRSKERNFKWTLGWDFETGHTQLVQ